MIALLAIGCATAVTDAQAMGSVSGSMKVGATVLPISCPAGRNLRSCVKPLETSAAVSRHEAASWREGGSELKLESVVGEFVVVTLTY